MKLTKYEMETIITFNEEEKIARVYTHNNALRRRLEKIAVDRPEECLLVRTDGQTQAVDYTIPKKWIRINPPRQPRVMSEEQKAEARERMAVVRNARFVRKD